MNLSKQASAEIERHALANGGSVQSTVEKERIALETIDEACERYGCTKVFALYSGGDDSEAARLIARQHKYFVAAVHCNTGIGIEATREHVREVCRADRCPLIEYKAVENTKKDGTPDPMVYESLVMKYGFPGPTKFGHGRMYVQLKERGLCRLKWQHTNEGEPFVLVAGCRSDESTRRMGHVQRINPGKSPLRRAVWVNIIHDWKKTDTLAYRESKGTPRNPVAKLICKSGECLCGGFGNEGELEELCLHDLTRPLGKYLLDLERRVIAAGFPWRWHEMPPKWFIESKRGQQFLFEMNKYATPGPMCQGCEIQAAKLIGEAQCELPRK